MEGQEQEGWRKCYSYITDAGNDREALPGGRVNVSVNKLALERTDGGDEDGASNGHEDEL